VGLHPLRNGLPAGGRGAFGLFKCPPKTPPAQTIGNIRVVSRLA
jgi:hypothetical protein